MSPAERERRIFSGALKDEKPNIKRIIDPSELTDQIFSMEGQDIQKLSDEIRDKILWGVYNDYGTLLKVSEMRDVEHLDDSDENAQSFKTFYLKGLREEPSAFGSSYDIESKKTPEEMKALLRESHVVGVKYSFATPSGNQKENLVGMGALKRGEGVQSHIANLGKVYVHPAHRKRWLAHNIVTHLLDKALEDGIEQVHLVVTASNVFAIEFYKKLGFIPGKMHYKAVKIEDEYYDWLHMELSMHDYKPEQTKK